MAGTSAVIGSHTITEMVDKVARTRVTTRPFPHLVIDDILPAPLRAVVDQYWPDRDRLITTNFSDRGERLISTLARSAETSREKAFWNFLNVAGSQVGQAVRSRLHRHLGEKFRPMIGPDWGRKLGKVTYSDRDGMIAHYTGRIDLPAHIDNARLVVNSFVYLDDPDQPTPEPRRGTMLYRSLGFAWPSNAPVPERLRERFLREDRDVAWIDNRLLAYVNGPWSFHGVPPHNLGDSRRRLLMFGSLIDPATADRVFDGGQF